MIPSEMFERSIEIYHPEDNGMQEPGHKIFIERARSPLTVLFTLAPPASLIRF